MTHLILLHSTRFVYVRLSLIWGWPSACAKLSFTVKRKSSPHTNIWFSQRMFSLNVVIFARLIFYKESLLVVLMVERTPIDQEVEGSNTTQ